MRYYRNQRHTVRSQVDPSSQISLCLHFVEAHAKKSKGISCFFMFNMRDTSWFKLNFEIDLYEINKEDTLKIGNR